MEAPDSQNIIQRVSPDRSAEQSSEQHHTYIEYKKKLSAEQSVCPELLYPPLHHRAHPCLPRTHISGHKQHGDHKGRTAGLIKGSQNIPDNLNKILRLPIP